MPSSDGAVLCCSPFSLPWPLPGPEPVGLHTSDMLEQGKGCSTALPTPTTQALTGCLLFALSQEQLDIPSSLVK